MIGSICLKLWHTHRYELILVLIILLTAILRLGLVDIPLERDEGEYAYAGQLILQGIPPYQELYTMKLPGVHLMYAGIMAVFGQTRQGIHTGLIVINAIVILTLFLLARRLMDSFAGLTTAAVFGVLSVGQTVQGFSANAEHFVLLFALPGFLLLNMALKGKKTWIVGFSGILLGTGVLMKQHGAVFVIFAFLYLMYSVLLERKVLGMKRGIVLCGVFVTGAAIPYIVICLIFFGLGIFDRFWFWTVEYARAYAASTPLPVAWHGFKSAVAGIVFESPLIWILVCAGLTGFFLRTGSTKYRVFIGGFAFASLLATVPGFYFRYHYFILILPAASMLAGYAVFALAESRALGRIAKNQKLVFSSVAVIVILISIFQSREYLFAMTPDQISRSTYGLNPFVESVEVGRFVREHTAEDDRIAIIGSEPQIFFYADRRSATGHIYMYPLMENHAHALTMQQEMMQEIERSEPAVLVYVHIDASWLMGPDSHTLIFDWLQRYGSAHHSPVGLVVISPGGTRYTWSPDVRIPTDVRNWILVLQKKDIEQNLSN